MSGAARGEDRATGNFYACEAKRVSEILSARHRSRFSCPAFAMDCSASELMLWCDKPRLRSAVIAKGLPLQGNRCLACEDTPE